MSKTPPKSSKYAEIIRKYGGQMMDGFKINDQNSVQLMTMAEYFANDRQFLKRDDSYSHMKGLFIQGPVGTGKTIAIKLFRNVMRDAGQGFRVIACRHVVREFMAQGNKTASQIQAGRNILDQYGRDSYTNNGGRRPLIVCFDDLGQEEIKSKHYGNETSVMAEILLDRYEEFIENGMITHVTSNLGAKALGEVYGERIRDRMREMFNQVEFVGDSFRK